MTIKIVTVVGARPQFIKAATVSRELASLSGFEEVLVHTGQHYDHNMSDIFFEELNIPKPAYNLACGGGAHGAMTGRQLEKIESVLLTERPDLLLVYGDTNSTLAGALAAAKLHIPVAHVEAGLRSYNRNMPEEINRVLTDHASELLFAPTQGARGNLLAEGIKEDGIHVVGDVMYDATLYYSSQAKRPSWYDDVSSSEGGYVLCTIHRAENTDDPFRLGSILEGLADSGLPVLLPLHPRTKRRIEELRLSVAANIHVVPPVGYLEMLWLEGHCRIVATDSGGVQKEAYFHGKPCVTLRDETEWTELVDGGFNRLVGTSPERIAESLASFGHINIKSTIYGNGAAAAAVLDVLAARRYD